MKHGFPNQDGKKASHNSNRKVCTHYNKTGHTVDTCYKKHGYPPGYKFQNGKTYSVNNIATQEEYDSNNNENGDTHFTHQQYQILTNLLKQANTSAGQAQVNQVGSFVAGTSQQDRDSTSTGNTHTLKNPLLNKYTWILDSRATDYVCFTLYDFSTQWPLCYIKLLWNC